MTCRAAINQARRPLPRHDLSFAVVTPEQEARGIYAVCLRCEKEVQGAEQWFSETCEGNKEAHDDGGDGKEVGDRGDV